MYKSRAKVLLSVVLTYCLFSLFTGVLEAKAEPIQASELIRLHVLANSESLQDQRIKLAVRDELLSVLQPLLATAASLAEAEQLIKANLNQLKQAAATVVAQLGADYEADFQLGLFNFPDKYYGKYTLPAGRYTALNVTLGTGEGRNWWCVIFPAMCFTAGVCQQVEVAEDQVYHLRSKLVEWVGKFLTWCLRR
ncbi:MAG: stage II sporulation protein R [Firmicutes bacterium]|nr:stage II sporulation protein R [Bacillota bacterium]